MKIQESAENYLEAVLMIKERNGEVRSIDIVNELGFSKPSISVAMKNLRNNGYITMNEKGFIDLTEKGMVIAQTMYERHKLFSKWLMEIGVEEKTAKEDACRMEHVMSAETFSAIKQFIEQHQSMKTTS